MKSRIFAPLVLALFFALRSGAAAPPQHVSLATMDANTRELFQDSMAVGATFYDDSVKLLKSPQVYSRREGGPRGTYHMVRESSWYALGLIIRDQPGDRQQAAEILDAVLKQQYLVQEKPWYGTFRRAPEEQDPPPNAVMWKDFDPNWRVFIGTTFEIILIDYPDRARLKIYVRVEILALDDDPDLTALVTMPDYKAKLERIFRLHLETFDWNCQQHITPRFTEHEIAEAVRPLRDRLAQLESENAELRSRLAIKGESQ